jgi:hypothetical protein
MAVRVDKDYDTVKRRVTVNNTVVNVDVVLGDGIFGVAFRIRFLCLRRRLR